MKSIFCAVTDEQVERDAGQLVRTSLIANRWRSASAEFRAASGFRHDDAAAVAVEDLVELTTGNLLAQLRASAAPPRTSACGSLLLCTVSVGVSRKKNSLAGIPPAAVLLVASW